MKNKAFLRALLSSLLAAVMLISGTDTDIYAVQPAAAYTEEYTPPVRETPDGVNKGVSDLPLNATQTIGTEYGSYVWYGFTERHSEGFYGDTKYVLPIEADYGLTAEASGMILYVTGYNHTNKSISIKSSKLDGKTSITLKMNTKMKIDTKSYETGPHYITTTFSNGKSLDLNFWVNTKEVRPCIKQKENYDLVVERHKALKKAMNAAKKSTYGGGFADDGSKSLALDQFYYPVYSWGKPSVYRCDTQRWIDQSNKIVKKDWSAEHKAYALMVWMADNIAYDFYASDLDCSRACKAWDWSGKYSVWDLKAGVCFDFSNAYAIMCRAQGIPCTTIGANTKSVNHVWNLVLINGMWTEIDLTALDKYAVRKKDASIRTKDNSDYDVSLYAFRIFPSWRKSLLEGAVVNYYLMYGDPTDEKANNHTRYVH